MLSTAAPTHVSLIEHPVIAFLLEPVLIAGSVLFWILVLPLAGMARLSVGAYDTVAAVLSRARRLEGLANHKGNPLVLRRGAAPAAKPVGDARVARQSI